MDETIISLQNVSKRFRRYNRPIDLLKDQFFPGKPRGTDFWALQEINLQLKRGQTLGIIGQNGAGKSTLLQIIAGTLQPTSGTCDVQGRISALLELGSGFNPDFTGRQNVFFNGRLLGLSEQQIESSFDQIAAFADIGDFLEQPVKTYSSGMFVRLAFAVAVSVQPDILVVDEALAVGDVYFQQKCFEKIRALQDRGTTLLFVSHDPASVYNLCESAILLESGRITLQSTPRKVLDLYEVKLLKKNDVNPEALQIQDIEQSIAQPTSTDGNSNSQVSNDDSISMSTSEINLEFVDLYNDAGQKIESIVSGQFVQLSVGVRFLNHFQDPIVGFKIRDRLGSTIFVDHTYNMNQHIGPVEPDTLVEIRFRFRVPLMESQYSVTIGVADSGFGTGQFKQALAYIHNQASLKVLRDDQASRWSGVVNLEPEVMIDRSTKIRTRN